MTGPPVISAVKVVNLSQGATALEVFSGCCAKVAESVEAGGAGACARTIEERQITKTRTTTVVQFRISASLHFERLLIVDRADHGGEHRPVGLISRITSKRPNREYRLPRRLEGDFTPESGG